MTIIECGEKKQKAYKQDNKKSDPILQFMYNNVPVVSGSDFYIVKHLWGKFFRVNYYKKEKHLICSNNKIIRSYFLKVIESGTGYTIENHTLQYEF